MSFVQNIVGFTKKSTLAKLGKSKTYNMFVETKDASEHAFTTILRPMPGYRSIASINGKPQGLFKVSRGYDGKPVVYGVWDRKLYMIQGDEPLVIGEVTSYSKCTFAETSGYGNTHPHLCICDGEQVYAVDVTLSYQRQIHDFRTIQTPLKYPNEEFERVKPAWIAQCYNYLIIGDTDTDIFYTSYQYPFESLLESGEIDYDIFDGDTTKETGGHGHWTMSEWQPDNTLIGCSNSSRLFTFGERSFQVFSYTGSSVSPFSSPDTASKNIGIRNKDSLAKFGDNVYWLGSSDMGENIIYTMGGDANPIRISTDEIEDAIRNYNKDYVKAFCIQWKSHPMYILTFLGNDVTFAFDIREGGWINLGSKKSSGGGIEGCYRYENFVIDRSGRILMQTEDKLVEALEPYKEGTTWIGSWFEHDGTPILRSRAGGMLSVDHKPFKVGAIKLMTNNGQYPLVTNDAIDVYMKYSTDGGAWKSIKHASMGRVGNYDYNTIFRHLGKVSYLTVEFGCADNVGFSIYGMDITGVGCKKP